MAQAHATHKGAIGLDMSDGKGGKEMIDAPMLKQVRDPHIRSFIRLTLTTQAEKTIHLARAAGLPIPTLP